MPFEAWELQPFISCVFAVIGARMVGGVRVMFLHRAPQTLLGPGGSEDTGLRGAFGPLTRVNPDEEWNGGVMEEWKKDRIQDGWCFTVRFRFRQPSFPLHPAVFRPGG